MASIRRGHSHISTRAFKNHKAHPDDVQQIVATLTVNNSIAPLLPSSVFALRLPKKATKAEMPKADQLQKAVYELLANRGYTGDALSFRRKYAEDKAKNITLTDGTVTVYSMETCGRMLCVGVRCAMYAGQGAKNRPFKWVELEPKKLQEEYQQRLAAMN